MDNFKIISQALTQNNADMNNLTIKINKIDTSKEDSFIVLNTDALAGLELSGDITAPELSTDVVLDLFGFNDTSALYYAIPTFDNKIFVLKTTLETFKVGSTSYTITNCTPCIGKMIPYGGNNILMLTFLFNTVNSFQRIMTLYVDGASSTNVKGRIIIDELSSGSSGDIPNLDEYITETELNGKGYATTSYVNGELAKKSDTGHTHSEYLTALPDNVVTYTTDETYGKSISTDTLHASRGILVVDENATDLSMDVIDWGTAIIKGIGIASEQVTSPKVGFTFNEYFGLEEGSTRPNFYWGENDYSRSATVAFTSDIPSTEGLATETYVNQKVADLVNGAPDTLNTLDELAAALKDNKDIVDVLNNSISTKQDTISDLETIRSGAALGATALQSYTEQYQGTVKAVDTTETVDDVSNDFVTSEQLDARGYATTANVSDEIDTINQTIGVNTSGYNLAERISRLENGFAVPDARAKVLWVGTSIPSSVEYWGVDNNYPKMVADILGFELYNMSRPSSCLSKILDPGWTTAAQYNAEPTLGRSLSMTKAEIDSTFRNTLETIRSNEGLATSWVENLLNDWKSHSYEELIMPYIDGTIAECDTVIIDHGFNDRFNIMNFCASFNNPEKDNLSYYPADVVGGDTDYAYPVKNGNQGWYWLQHFGDTQYYDAHEFARALWSGVETTPDFKNNYFGAMMFVIRKIWSVNPRIRIIIGNYFSQDYGLDEYSIYCTKYILEANIQLAKFCGLNCVNVYNYTALRNRPITLADGTETTDMLIFCPDGVHPGSDLTGQSNKIIAGAYINAIRGTLYI